MTGFIEDQMLKFAGLSDDDIAKFNERLPDVLNLLHVIQAHQAQLNRVISDLAPILQKLIIKQQELGK